MERYDGEWTGKDVEGISRGLICCIIPVTVYRRYGKPGLTQYQSGNANRITAEYKNIL